LINEEFINRFISYFGGSFGHSASQRRSTNLAFLKEFSEIFKKSLIYNTYNNHSCSQLNCRDFNVSNKKQWKHYKGVWKVFKAFFAYTSKREVFSKGPRSKQMYDSLLLGIQTPQALGLKLWTQQSGVGISCNLASYM
jgi:hypothetical protein